MKKVILFLLFCTLSTYSQSKDEVKKILIERYTHKSGDTIHLPNWDFLNDTIKSFNLPFISSKLKSKIFFKTKFSFLDDLHSSFDDCIIMFDNQTKEVIVHLPFWYFGMEKKFYKEFIGISLLNKIEKKQFAEDLGAIFILYNNKSKIKNIVVDKNMVVLNIISPNDDYPDILQIFFSKNKIIEIKWLTGKYQNIEDTIK